MGASAELDGGLRRELPPINSVHRGRLDSGSVYGCAELTDALSCCRSLIGRVSMLTQTISLVLLCLGAAAFVADSALGPSMLATAIAAWLLMPDTLMTASLRSVCAGFAWLRST